MVGVLPQIEKNFKKSLIEWINPKSSEKTKEFNKPKSKFHK